MIETTDSQANLANEQICIISPAVGNIEVVYEEVEIFANFDDKSDDISDADSYVNN